MDKIKTQDCYLPVDMNERVPTGENQYHTIMYKEKGIALFDGETFHLRFIDADLPFKKYWLEKHSNMVVLTESEYLSNKVERWVSVEDRLPEEKKDSLCGYSENVNVTDGKDVWTSCWWLYPLNQWNSEDEENKITHWQPLPSPPTSPPFK